MEVGRRAARPPPPPRGPTWFSLPPSRNKPYIMPRGFVKIGVGGGGGRRALSLFIFVRSFIWWRKEKEGKMQSAQNGGRKKKMGQQAEVREGKEEKGANSIFISARQVATTTMWW